MCKYWKWREPHWDSLVDFEPAHSIHFPFLKISPLIRATLSIFEFDSKFFFECGTFARSAQHHLSSRSSNLFFFLIFFRYIFFALRWFHRHQHHQRLCCTTEHLHMYAYMDVCVCVCVYAIKKCLTKGSIFTISIIYYRNSIFNESEMNIDLRRKKLSIETKSIICLCVLIYASKPVKNERTHNGIESESESDERTSKQNKCQSEMN